MDTYNYDQRESALEAGHLPKLERRSSRIERMISEIIRRAEHGQYVLLVVKSRAVVMDIGCYIPLNLSRFITVRCIDSHPDINWITWKAPGWENHELFVDPEVLCQQFPNIARMFNI